MDLARRNGSTDVGGGRAQLPVGRHFVPCEGRRARRTCSASQHDPTAGERALRCQRGHRDRRSRGPATGAPTNALPLRRIEQQAVLRWHACRGWFRGYRRAVVRSRDEAARSAQRPARHHTDEGWATGDRRLRGTGERHRPHDRQDGSRTPVPLRRLQREAVLRRHALSKRLHGPLGLSDGSRGTTRRSLDLSGRLGGAAATPSGR